MAARPGEIGSGYRTAARASGGEFVRGGVPAGAVPGDFCGAARAAAGARWPPGDARAERERAPAPDALRGDRGRGYRARSARDILDCNAAACRRLGYTRE